MVSERSPAHVSFSTWTGLAAMTPLLIRSNRVAVNCFSSIWP